MTVETEQSAIIFTGIVDGVALNVPFPVQATTELKVRYGSADTLATSGVDYIAALVPPEYLTATITPKVGFAVTSGGTISVRREVPYTQPTDIPTLVTLGSSRLEQMIDRLVFIAQQLRDKLVYSLQFPTTDNPTDNIGQLPSAADRASKYLAFGPTGKPIAAAANITGTPVTAFGAAWVALASAAAAQLYLGITTVMSGLLASASKTAARVYLGIVGPQSAVTDFGAVADCQLIEDVSMTATSAVLNSVAYNFVVGDIGKTVGVDGAGVAGATLEATILSVSAGNATLSVAAGTTVASAACIFGTDNTAAFQAAATASSWRTVAGGRRVCFEEGTYLLNGTISVPTYGELEGKGKENTIIRTFKDFGDVFVWGTDTVGGAAGAPYFAGFGLYHGTMYEPGDTRLTFPTTSGAWVRWTGAQQGIFQDVIAWRKTFCLYIHGGSVNYLTDFYFLGVWDHTVVALQEGIANLVTDLSTNHGICKDLTLQAPFGFLGMKSAARNVTLTVNGGPVVKNMVVNIGPQYGALFNSIETLYIGGGYVGACNTHGLYFNPKASPALIANVRVVGTHFDSARMADVEVLAQDPANPCLDISVTGRWNGQLNGFKCVNVDHAAGDPAKPSVINLEVRGIMGGYYGSLMTLDGVSGGIVSVRGTNWNCLDADVSPGADLQYCAGAWVTGSSTGIVFDGGSFGGGGNFNAPTGDPSNHCYEGIVVDPANVVLGCKVRDVVNTGVLAFSRVATPAVPASTVVTTNPYPERVQVSIYGGTVTAVKHRTVTISDTTPCTFVLDAGDSYSITHAVAPTMVWQVL